MKRSRGECIDCGRPSRRAEARCLPCYLAHRTAEAARSVAVRLYAKADRSGGPDACWPWLAYINSTGYGRIGRPGSRRSIMGAHQLAYELAYGPVPAGLQIDHLCRNRACVNPAHLEAVTMRENILRGTSLSAQRAKQTHCLRGHPFDAVNTYWYGRHMRQRQCRACNAMRKGRVAA